ncbi:hypothetical protein AAKU55_005477, partial [Oxalobacteraceae bacterium GrIS 1.11]
FFKLLSTDVAGVGISHPAIIQQFGEIVNTFL